MTRDEKTDISHDYIRLVMDIDKVQSYPWGRQAFKLLLESIIKTEVNLTRPTSYVLDGFSYAFQIWVIEAIPIIGNMLGRKIQTDLVESPRCSNWKGAGRVSYEDIIDVEKTFQKNDILYPFISSTGNFDIYEAQDFLWSDAIQDAGVCKLNITIREGNDFGEHIWETVEPVQSIDGPN